MPNEEVNLKINADPNPLKNSLKEIESALAQLDQAVGRHSDSIARTLAKMVGISANSKSGRGNSALEKLAAPLLQQAVSGVLNTLGKYGQNGAQNPVNVAMNIATPDANSFRMSQGQIWAEAAAAITRATKRYL